jgi:MFS family permease
MFAPNLLLTSEVAHRAGEGIFGAFQIAGSVGFLLGPATGGALVALLRDESGAVRYADIFTIVGGVELVLAGASALALGRLLRRRELDPRPLRDGLVAAD